MADYARTWIEHRNVKPRTKAHYHSLLDRHIAPLGRVLLRNLTPEAVRAWYASLGTRRPTVNAHAYGVLHAVCATAVGDGLLVANPCRIPRAMHALSRREPVLLTVAEAARLADAIEPERFKALVLISAWCGVRWVRLPS